MGMRHFDFEPLRVNIENHFFVAESQVDFHVLTVAEVDADVLCSRIRGQQRAKGSVYRSSEESGRRWSLWRHLKMRKKLGLRLLDQVILLQQVP